MEEQEEHDEAEERRNPQWFCQHSSGMTQEEVPERPQVHQARLKENHTQPRRLRGQNHPLE